MKRATAEKLASLNPWQRHEFNPEFTSYQSCRFCHRGVIEVGALWKYSVRHYACDECRDRIITEAGLARSGLYGTSRLSAEAKNPQRQALPSEEQP